jgi:ligand-binding sensor protein
MNNKPLHIRDIIADSDFQKMQDEIAVATNAAVITVDYSGTPVTNHSLCSDFCRLVRSNPKYKHLCEKCDSRGGVEAARLKKPYVYLCHMGLSDFAVPVIIDDVYVGAVMAGQILIEESDKDKLERILSEKSECKGIPLIPKLILSFPLCLLIK